MQVELRGSATAAQRTSCQRRRKRWTAASNVLLNFDKLSRYGKKADEVWRRPTPPAPPPSCLLEKPRARWRQEVLANGDGQKEDYGGPGIPYGEKIVPSDLVDDDEDEDWHWGQGGEQKGLIPQLANDAETGVALCWDLIRNVSGQDPLHTWWCTRI